jgi:serine/threonine protein kinase
MFSKKGKISSLQVVDFGLSAQYRNKDQWQLTDKCGTGIYMAPEVHFSYEYSKVEIYLKG